MPRDEDNLIALEDRRHVAAMDFHHTDLGNAQRLVHEHGGDLRYVPGLGWHAWDGRRWRRDEDGETMRRAKATVVGLYELAAKLPDRDRAELLEHAKSSERDRALKAMVALAESERKVVARVAELDTQPFLLNVANGTVDLRTGELREHRREDLLTMLSPVVYQPDARHELWDRFLDTITGGDTELEAFLQRATGYSLTGDTSEEVLPFAHGPEATGKSTFLEGAKSMLGDYAKTADFETFLKRRGDAGIRNDIARLVGARMVVSVEVDEGKEFAEGLLKLVTGGDTIAARYLYRETFEFVPQFKLWLAANHRPKVNADDGAMWRRIIQVPFTTTIPPERRDPEVKRRIKTDPAVQQAILAWAVEGCLRWQRDGLDVPERVRDYTYVYRQEQDPLADWIGDECLVQPDIRAYVRDLRRSYDRWCERNGIMPLKEREFGAKLEARGFTSRRDHGGRYRTGIGVEERDTS